MSRTDHLVHVNMGEIGWIIDAPTEEEAIRIATVRASKIVTQDTVSHIHPRVVRINGKPYEAPPLTVRNC
jgi:hypothetical protein